MASRRPGVNPALGGAGLLRNPPGRRPCTVTRADDDSYHACRLDGAIRAEALTGGARVPVVATWR